MRGAISKSGVRSLAGRGKRKVWRGLNGHEGESWTQPRPTWSHRLRYSGGQGVHREVESEGPAEKYRAVIEGDNPPDEPVGPRWGKVESAFPRRRRSHSPTTPRGLRAARYGRTTRNLRRTGRVSG